MGKALAANIVYNLIIWGVPSLISTTICFTSIARKCISFCILKGCIKAPKKRKAPVKIELPPVKVVNIEDYHNNTIYMKEYQNRLGPLFSSKLEPAEINPIEINNVETENVDTGFDSNRPLKTTK